jgi:8-amino-7-oxononanoate synthase
VNDFDFELSARLDALRRQGLSRRLIRIDSAQAAHIVVDGRPMLNFSSNDYLGLANEPALKEASAEAARAFGAGSGASRLICGSLAPHAQLEETLAAFKDTEAALAFSTGYAAGVGTICALVDHSDIIILDKLVHACIVDAARLSGAKIRVFEHNNLADLEEKLKWAADRQSDKKDQERPGRILVATESVFSMDGDIAPLREMARLKQQYGAWLMVDEAHATGIFGAHRRGMAEELGVSQDIEVQMGTLGKAIGASGGYICGSKILVDYLVNRARSFIFSTAPVPAAAAAAAAGIRLIQSPQGLERKHLLWQRLAELRPDAASAIVPVMIGAETKAAEAAAALRERGLFIPAIRYPTVARGEARLRVTVTASHTAADIARLRGELAGLGISL